MLCVFSANPTPVPTAANPTAAQTIPATRSPLPWLPSDGGGAGLVDTSGVTGGGAGAGAGVSTGATGGGAAAGLRGLGSLGKSFFALADVPFYIRLVAIGNVVVLAQILAETRDCLLPAAVLLIAAPLVKDVVGVIASDQKVGKNIDALLIVPQSACLLGGLLPRSLGLHLFCGSRTCQDDHHKAKSQR
jgi:hypothetical protein